MSERSERILRLSGARTRVQERRMEPGGRARLPAGQPDRLRRGRRTVRDRQVNHLPSRGVRR